VNLFAEPVGVAVQLLPKVVVHPAELSELNHRRLVEPDPAKAGEVGPRGVGKHKRVATIILRARGRVTVAEAIQLLRID
jgi:hypothetical protein